MEKLLADKEKNFDLNYCEICENIKFAAEKAGKKIEDITLLAATKTVDAELINYSIEKGIRCIGENRVQEFLSKEDYYDKRARRHFIGHLQTNKVKDIVGRVEMIESVSSLHLAKEISKQSVKLGVNTDILLEVNIGNEESKSGFLKEDVINAAIAIAKLPAVSIKGLMSIPPICENADDNRKYFAQMHKLFIDIDAQKGDNISMNYLSMGMSDDYAVAIEEGANLVRIGTALYGKRNYNI